MGLGLSFLRDLITLKRSGEIGNAGRVVEVGAQQLADNFLEATDELDELYALFGRRRDHLGERSGTAFEAKAPPSAPFWTSLGFEYMAIDYGGHRNSISLDLNRDRVPRRLRGAFDLVINTGTTEHVANQDNAFRIIHDLAFDVGGIMYHEVPGGGMGDHGLISYHPRFFSRLCDCNGYRRLLEACDGVTIRVALRKRQLSHFQTPLDLPDHLMPREPRDPAQLPHSGLWNVVRKIRAAWSG
jgi:hypothetical protein